MISSILDLEKKAEKTVGISKACSNRRNGENEYSGSQKPPTKTRRKERRSKKRPLCDGYR